MSSRLADLLLERRAAVYFLWFLPTISNGTSIWPAPVSDLVLRRIHELQQFCCSFGTRRRAGVCEASSPYPAESFESCEICETCESCAGDASDHSGGHHQNDQRRQG